MSNIVKLLASILGALTLFGCVSSSSDNEDAPSKGKIHPTNWIDIHMVDALADLDSCRNCHGFNLDGGSVGLSCLVCHPGAPADFSDFHALEKVLMAPSCSECHVATGATIDPTDDKVHNSCTVTCHDADYQLVSPPPALAPLHNAVGGDCTACHDAYFDNHLHGTGDNHDVLMRATDLSNGAACNTCHGMFVNDWTGILALHTNDCAMCHSSARTTNIGGGFSSVKNVIAIGLTVACLDCHAGKTIAHGTDHTPSGFSYVLVNNDTSTHTANCVRCHTGDVLTTVHDRATTGGTASCQKCHNADGALIGSAVAGGGECITCHVTYFDGHSHGTGVSHDVLMRSTDLSSGAACNTCHRRGGITTANPLFINAWEGTDGIFALHQNSCNLCHNSNRTMDMGGGYTSVQNAILTGTTVGCLDCHASRVNAHNIKHSASRVTGAAKCISCHGDGTVSDGNYITNIHGAFGCGTCHVNVAGSGPLHDYSITGGTINDLVNYETLNTGNGPGKGGSCVGCHVRYDTNFETGHQHETHIELTIAPTCATNCHAGNVLTAVHNNTCTTCHTNPITDGTFIIGAKGNGTAADHVIGVASSCSDCHGGLYNYDTTFTVHDVQDHTGLTTSTSCATTCHTAATAALIVSTTHNNTCTNCHTNTTTDGTLNSGLNGDATGGAGDCASCHAAYAVNYKVHDVGDHSGVTANATPVGKRDDCSSTCHTGDKISAVAAGLSPGTHQNDCLNCHKNNSTDATLIVGVNGYGDASGHSLAVASDCNACHAAAGYFNTHTHGIGETHNVTMAATDKSNGALCNTCHRRGGTGSANPLFTNLWSGADAIYALHTSTCTICHDSTRTTNMSGGYTGVQDALNTATTVECLHCHSDRSVSHGGHTPPTDSKVSWTPSCDNIGCHNVTGTDDVISVVHNVNAGVGANGCGLCHVDPLGGGVLIPDLANDVTAANGGPCADCHRSDLLLGGNGISFHGVTAAAVDVRHDNLDTSGGSLLLTVNAVPSFRAVGYTGKLNPAVYLGRLATDYNCANCHLVSTAAARVLTHGLDTATASNCIVCHSGVADFEAVITAGKGGTGVAQNCEACHNATINGGGNTNSPTNKAMYQYDGIRHHTHIEATAGNCDYCHADPRPANPLEATGYAYTATSAADHSEGWETEFTKILPVGIKDTNGADKMSCSATFCHNSGSATGYGVNSIDYTPANLTSAPGTTAGTWWDVISHGVVQPAFTAVPSHTISHTANIKISNYGMCLSCHTVQVWHGKPDWAKASDTAASNRDNAFDTLRYAPGKSVWTLKPGVGATNPDTAKFDIFAIDDLNEPVCAASNNLTGGVAKVRMFFRYNLSGNWEKPYEGTASETRGKDYYKDYRDKDCLSNEGPWKETYGARINNIFNRVTIPNVPGVNNFEGLLGSDPSVPVFINVQ